ncbi:hypothetical protein CK203_013858 [Vitis vinifera]|uniref:Integrase catalytic domain-containing protein n=1 Tax=Vitis vinifera TaxID=29760 RepID=A0A438JJB8_VITVI|nr:hypothetical protein CK203_013858 [Vitis vinifera]
MKGQVMADFVLEYSRRPSQHHESSKQEWWTLRVDGASRSSGSGVGLLLQSPTGEHLEQAIRLGFSASNNEAEYEAILSGLDLALALSVSKLRIYSDSQLVNISGQALYPEIQTGTKSGASCPFHPDWGAPVQAILHRTLPSCLGHSEAQYVLAELHEGICGNHSGGRSLAHRAHSQGYYWPTMKKDAAAYVKNVINVKVGPLPAAPAQKKFLLVATDYFSKWVEAEAYASIKDKDVTNIAFRNFCSELNIRNSYSTPRYPQSNGQAEATNKTLITALKKRLEQAKGKWVEELPGVLWAYRTTPGRPTGNTPFALAYGMDAVIPTEIDEVEGKRPSGWQTINKGIAHYNRKVRPRSFKNGTLVLRKVFENTAEVGAGNSKLTGKDPI